MMPVSPFKQLLDLPVVRTTSGLEAAVNRFCGWSFRETAAVPAKAAVRFRVGASDGPIIAVWSDPGGGSQTVELGPWDTPDGVYVEVVTGTVEGVIFNG